MAAASVFLAIPVVVYLSDTRESLVENQLSNNVFDYRITSATYTFRLTHSANLNEIGASEFISLFMTASVCGVLITAWQLLMLINNLH